MDVNEFRKDFLEDIKITAQNTGDGSVASFVNIFTKYLVESEVLPDFSNSFYEGYGKNNRKMRVDGYTLDELDFTFTLVIADYTGKIDREDLIKTNAVQLFDRLSYFIIEIYKHNLVSNVEESTPVSDLIGLLLYHKLRIRKFRFILLTDGFMSGRINTISDSVIEGIPLEYQIWDVARLYKVCVSDNGKLSIEIDFKAYDKGGLPCLEASNSESEDYKSFLCIIPGKVLADIYDQYGGQLLEGNVRSFLSSKVAVNKKIRETILRLPTKFFAYNNGISATARDLKIEENNSGKYIIYAKDFQIINGGQTTASLSNARFKDKASLDDIFVQMKLTEVDNNNDKSVELIRSISKSSNSQNKVSDVDFFSTHPFHIRIESISRRIYAPATGGAQFETKWFYERARGQYLQEQIKLKKSEKDNFLTRFPKKQLITKTDIAKLRCTWMGLPHYVSRGAQTNFMKFAEIIDEEWNTNESTFNEKYYRDTISLAILFRHTEMLVTQQSWYEQGYRANIVTYSIALFKKLIEKQFSDKLIDLQIIWNKQDIPVAFSDELKRITKFVFDTITDPTRETMNVTQYCKRESCWAQIRKCDIEIDKGITSYLIDFADEKVVVIDAKKVQKIDSGIENQTIVVNLGSETWKRVNDFVNNKKIGSPDEIVALKCAMLIPNKVPNTYQSQLLLKLLEKIKIEGFKE